MNPDILYDIVTISDPFGPTITDESLQCIVLSEETRKGGDAINIKRKEKVSGWCGIQEFIFVCLLPFKLMMVLNLNFHILPKVVSELIRK